MNAIQEKIKRISKFIAIITKILYITGIVMVCVGLAGDLWYVISPESGSFTVGHVRVLSPMQFASDFNVGLDLFTNIAAQCFFIAVLIITYRIFKDISRDSSPFMPKNISRMKKIAILLFVSSVVSPAVNAAVGKSLSLTNAESMNYSSEIIILSVIIYCFALIFQYGAELQQQSDETL